jgi:hypothetical protein
MKFVAVLTTLVLANAGFGQTTTPERTPEPAPKAVKRIDLTPAAAAKAATNPKAPAKAADKNAPKKEEPPGKIEGQEIPRGDGRFFGIQVVDSVFKLSFYDAKKKPIVPDVAYAVLRWTSKHKTGDERVVLMPDGKLLTSPKNIRPPYAFKLFITLFKAPPDGADPVATENFVIDFNQ